VQIPKRIYIFWLQGWESAPRVAKASLRSWQVLNPKYEIIKLDESILYKKMEHHLRAPYNPFRYIKDKWKIRYSHLSDILRIMLLVENGGIWVDATTICRKPLDEWLGEYTKNNFFAFANSINKVTVASWFLASTKGNYIILNWAQDVDSYWKKNKKAHDYFWLHELYSQRLKDDIKFRKEHQLMPFFDASQKKALGPHKFVPYKKKLLQKITKDIKEDIDKSDSPLFKLTNKVVCNKNSVFDYLLQP